MRGKRYGVSPPYPFLITISKYRRRGREEWSMKEMYNVRSRYLICWLRSKRWEIKLREDEQDEIKNMKRMKKNLNLHISTPYIEYSAIAADTYVK